MQKNRTYQTAPKFVHDAIHAVVLGIAESTMDVTTNCDDAGVQNYYDLGRALGRAVLAEEYEEFHDMEMEGLAG